MGISIHALLAESDFVSRIAICTASKFLSTLSLRRATRSLKRPFGTMHRFLSTLSLRRATICGACCSAIIRNFYPRSPCGERLGSYHFLVFHHAISIHALLAESDHRHPCDSGRCGHFYPRSPCGERQCARGPLRGKAPFLSTLSLRRATILAPLYNPDIVFLSTLSLRRATRAFAVYNPPGGISIHALLAESDVRQGMATLSQPIFLSTLSLRRATDNTGHSNRHWKISIHALLAESD